MMVKGHKLGPRTIRRLQGVLRENESRYKTEPPPSSRQRPGDIRWFNVHNDSGEDIPGHAIAVLGDGTTPAPGELIDIPDVTKPGTTFARQYCVIAPGGIPSGENGFATIDSPVHIAYDPSASPSNGDGYGPKPGSWFLFANYPATTDVIRATDTTRKILFGSLREIHSAIGKTTGAVTGGTSPTTAYRFYTTVGGIFSGADVGLTTVPSAYSMVDLDDDLWIKITPVGDACLLEQLVCNA